MHKYVGLQISKRKACLYIYKLYIDVVIRKEKQTKIPAQGNRSFTAVLIIIDGLVLIDLY